MPYIYLIISFLLNGIANLMLRFSALNEPNISFGIIRSLRSDASLGQWIMQFLSDHKWLLIGLTIFATNVIFYMLALRNLPVSIAYPVMVAMSLLIVASGANILFKEPLNSMQVIGYILLIVSIYLLTAKTFIKNN